jgi:NADH dehydrogenase
MMIDPLPASSSLRKPRIVIVGAGFAGLSAAQNLRKVDAEIILIDRHNYHLFQPLLYQVATAALSPAQIAQPTRAIMRKQKNCTVALGNVTAIDPIHKTISGDEKTLPYDYLVLATGATHTYFGHDDWARYAPGLKYIDDAIHIRRHILSAFEKAEIATTPDEKRACLTFAVIGAGPTGVEMAGAIAELARHTLRDDFKHIDPTSARVLLIEAGPRILSAFPETLSAKAHRALEKIGVEICINRSVIACSDTDVTIKNDTQDELIPARTLIWAAGVKASPAAQWLQAAHDKAGRVIVNPDLSVPHHPDIFVIGDTAHIKNTNGSPVPGLAPAAMQQGQYVAQCISARLNAQEPPAPFHYKDRGIMATIGRGAAIAKISSLQFSGFFAWLIWGLIHIMPLVGFRNRIIVAFDWLWSYLTHARGARLITASKSTQNDL